ncbi:hypothetical protein [Pseudomonas synxantha]|uniref:Uncharacterized protein n=1 Tax=Pseudomonas synxantha TaxID=47883 RepID=A0ACC6JTS1_9PSED|nr:hypothetical protein [Pseudomonas synxantha]MDR6609552.1 hypothetical protein [Pseudomonas synxantha]
MRGWQTWATTAAYGNFDFNAGHGDAFNWQQDVSAFQAFLQILRSGFIQALNARYERSKPNAG